MNMSPHCSAQKTMRSLPVAFPSLRKTAGTQAKQMIELFETFRRRGHRVFNPIAGMDEPYYCRNKVTSPLCSRTEDQRRKEASGQEGAMSVQRAHRSTKSFAACTQLARTASSTPIPAFLENKDAKQAVWAIRSLMQRYHMVSPITKTPTQASFVTPLYA